MKSKQRFEQPAHPMSSGSVLPLVACCALLAVVSAAFEHLSRKSSFIVPTESTAPRVRILVFFENDEVLLFLHTAGPCGRFETVRPTTKRSQTTGLSYSELRALGPGEHRVQFKKRERAVLATN